MWLSVPNDQFEVWLIIICRIFLDFAALQTCTDSNLHDIKPAVRFEIMVCSRPRRQRSSLAKMIMPLFGKGPVCCRADGKMQSAIAQSTAQCFTEEEPHREVSPDLVETESVKRVNIRLVSLSSHQVDSMFLSLKMQWMYICST